MRISDWSSDVCSSDLINNRTTRNMSRLEIATIVETAHERGAKVRAHVAEREMLLECVELGVAVVDHGDEIDDEIIERMVEAGTFWVPSLVYVWSLLELGMGKRFEIGRARLHSSH